MNFSADAINFLPAPGPGKTYSHREIVTEMAAFARPDTRRGALLFAADFTLFWAAIAGVLWLPGLGWRLAASVAAGIKMANLATLAHDAAHNALTASRRLNWWIGVLSFMPCLYNYRLWVYDHHALHHPHTNGEHADSYQPLSKAAYDALSPMAKRWYRFTRSSNPFAFGIYYITQRWSRVKLMPGAFLPATHRRSAWRHFVFVAVYFASFACTLAAAPLYANASSATALLLGLALPFFVFQSLMGASLYVNHTHPAIPWFGSEAERRASAQPEWMAVHLRLPKWLAALIHHFFEHPAHHVYPAIPCYRLWDAQQKLNEMLGERAIVETFSLRRLAHIQRACKLYDYALHRWLDFDGRPTAPACQVAKHSYKLAA